MTISAENKPIVDFGERITGARKDVWGMYNRTMQDALPGNFADFTMGKNFPEPDFEKAIAGGASADNLAMMKALRDLIPAKPRNSWKLERWGKLVRLAHGITQKMVACEFKMEPARLDELMAGVGGGVAKKVMFYRRLGYPLFTVADGWHIDSGERFVPEDRDLPYNERKQETVTCAINNSRWLFESRNQNPGAAYDEVFEQIKTKLAEQIGQPGEARKTAFALYSNRATGGIFIGKKCARGVVHVKDGFKIAGDARSFLADHRPELETIWEEKSKTPMLRKAANEPRQGIARRGGNVSPEMFAATFGFRGVQFGNYVEDDRRQSDLNEAHDALIDMAEALNLPPMALSLSGSLGMAFGARGTGGNKAHYEPGQIVINITKTHGPGSLAHEWFHAVDNYLARVDAGSNASTDKFITEDIQTASGVRGEVLEAFKQIRLVLSRGAFAKRSDELDCTRSKAYYGTTIEKAARAFEIFISDKLAAVGIVNDYVANIYKGAEAQIEWEQCAYPFPREMEADGIRSAFAGAFNILKADGSKIN